MFLFFLVLCVAYCCTSIEPFHIPKIEANVKILLLDLENWQFVHKCAINFKLWNLPFHLLVKYSIRLFKLSYLTILTSSRCY